LSCFFSFSSETGGRLGVLGALLPDRLRSSMLLDLVLGQLLHLQNQAVQDPSELIDRRSNENWQTDRVKNSVVLVVVALR
jgi:hypothetical protein